MMTIYLNKMKTVLTSQFMKRFFSFIAFVLVFGCVTAFAQADTNMGTSALAEVTTKVAAYIPYVQNLIYAIAGVVAVIGAIQVYMKMNNGDQDVSKSIMMLVGACLFLVAAAVALPKFFGVG